MTILGRSEGLVSRCVECDLAEPESLASLGGSAPGVVDGILSDANLHHDLATGKAVTAVLHFLNQTPIDAYSKRHHLVSYHRVKEAIAAKYISFHWKDGKSNPADILSKHLEFATVWPMLKPILFWRGETATQLKGSDRIPSTTRGAEPPRDAKDSGSARSHSTHLETSSSDRP